MRLPNPVSKMRRFEVADLMAFSIGETARTRVQRIWQYLLRAVLINRITNGMPYISIPSPRALSELFDCHELFIYTALYELHADGCTWAMMSIDQPLIIHDHVRQRQMASLAVSRARTDHQAC